MRHWRPASAYYPPASTFGPRRLDSFELVWLLSGTASWIWHDTGTTIGLPPGTLLLARPGMRDEFHWHTPCRHGFVHFELLPSPETTGWPITRAIAKPSPLGGMLDYLLWLGTGPTPDWAQRVEDIIGILVRTFVAGPLPDRGDNMEPPVLATALDYVRREWSRGMRPVSLSELAASANVSKEYLSRLFQRHFGVGPVAGLELVRLARADTLLSRSNLTITQIARDCGFTDPLHFSRRFKHVYGVSPRAYRQVGEQASPLTEHRLLTLALRLSKQD